MNDITQGSIVLYPLRPEWGLGIVEWVLHDRCSVGFETPTGPFVDEFALGELEPARQLEAA